jgi:hypothetical protein
MGASGHLPFDNDDAMDFAGDVQEAKDASVLADAFAAIPDEDAEYVEAPEASRAIAAAEILAAMQGNELAPLPEEVLEWMGEQDDPSHTLVREAIRAVSRVLRDSELASLWEETDTLVWKDSVNGLLHRLGA